MAFIGFLVDNVNSQSFNVSIAVHHFVRNLLWAAKISHIFQTVSVFQCSVTLSRVAHAAHQAVVIKAGVCCLHVCNFSILACIILVVASIYRIMWKSRVFLNFLWVVYCVDGRPDNRNWAAVCGVSLHSLSGLFSWGKPTHCLGQTIETRTYCPANRHWNCLAFLCSGEDNRN
jgi:hypothetical protein